MNRIWQVAIIAGAALTLFGGPPIATAGALPYTQWMTMKVDRCEEVTFKAPQDNTWYVPNAIFKTAVVSGEVLTSGVDFSGSDALDQRFADRAAAGLPEPGESYEVAVVRGFTPVTCQALTGTTRKFVFVKGACDTLPRSGACVVSKPLAVSFASA